MNAKRMGRAIGRFFARTWVWSLCLVLLLALGIWFLGPLLAVGETYFWASAGARLISIAGLFLLWGLFIVFSSWWGARRRKAALSDEELQQREQREARLDEEQNVLAQRFREALRTLATSSMYRGQGRRRRQELPWYLVIGPQGSGKTSLLDFSGLDFPLERGAAERLTRDVSGTRHADWYFAEHAVLIDTAGRYVTQPEPAIDGNAWQTLLGLLRKRRARPLNGVLVNLSVEQLLQGDELSLEVLARQIRQRLAEIHQRLAVEVPVYLVLSKTDLLPGFDEFFDLLSREESEQVLGSTFGEGQDGTQQGVLGNALNQLLGRLNAQVMQRIHQERDCSRRGLILDFPRQLGQLGERLCLFVELAFSGNRYQRASSLRGFYFTSAPHLTENLDPLTSGIGRQLGLSSQSLPSLRQGRARFIHQLLARVIFPESELASLDHKERSRIDWGQRALYAGAFGCLALGALFWIQGFSANQDRLDQVRELAGQWQGERQALEAAADTRASLPLLDTSYAATQVFPAPGEVSYLQRGGLYQGEEVDPAVSASYREDLRRELLPRVQRQLEANIRASLGDRERLLGNLRAYLMLQLVERRDTPFLEQWMASDWSRRYLGDAQTQEALSAHFARLLDAGFAPQALDDDLVAQARHALRGDSLAAVFYRLMRERAAGLPDYSLARHLGSQGAVFTGADYRIPGLYTAAGYRGFFLGQGRSLVQELLRDNWVMGGGERLSAQDFERLFGDIEKLYLRDYADHWGEAINSLALAPASDNLQVANLLAGLTAANSPLLQLLGEIRENTYLAAPPMVSKASDALGKAAGAAGVPGAEEALKKAVAEAEVTHAGQSLARRFDGLRQLLDEQGGAVGELTGLMQALDALQLQMDGLAHAGSPEQAAFELARTRMSGGSRDAFAQLRNSAARLPQPLSGWFSRLSDSSWTLVLNDAHQYLNERYRGELYSFYRNALRQRYPFEEGSDSEVSIGDFRDFFKADGVAANFVDKYLAPFINTGGDSYRARSVDGHGLPLSREFLAQLQQVQAIRRSFFADDPSEPRVRFRMEPYALDSSLGRSDFRFGGQELEYRHGPIVEAAFVWPSEVGDGRSSLVIEELGGRRLGIERNTGPWSLFRLFDSMQAQPHSGRDVLMLRADIDGRRADYLLHTQRSPNPFDIAQLRRFRLPAVL